MKNVNLLVMLVLVLSCFDTFANGTFEFVNLSGATTVAYENTKFPVGATKFRLTAEFVENWNAGWGDSLFTPIDVNSSYTVFYNSENYGMNQFFAVDESEHSTATLISCLSGGGLLGFCLMKGIKWA